MNNNHTLDIGTAESNKSGPMRLILSFYCPDCETMHHHEVTATSVQALCEQIEDIRVSCPDCGYMWMGVHTLSIKDNDTEYEIPLWHGPVETVNKTKEVRQHNSSCSCACRCHDRVSCTNCDDNK